MNTVARRTIRSSPYRDAAKTWDVIVDLLCARHSGNARAELLAIGGIGMSIIADGVPKDAPIVVTCDGPRTRLYCLYDDDAVSGGDANEDALGFDALKGDWLMSLPCNDEDLDWVRTALRQHSSRISARSAAEDLVPVSESGATAPEPLTIDPKAFLGT